MSEIRVAIAGIGNCASALIQGIEYYRNTPKRKKIPGLMHVNFGRYHIRDIKVVAAFEVNKEKIGKDVSEAIFVKPNSCIKFSAVPNLGVKVKPAPVLDGVAEHMKNIFQPHELEKTEKLDIKGILRETDADMLINYLPVGSRKGTHFYAQSALDAKCAFVNCIPEFIVSDVKWSNKFRDKGLPIAGDDIKSQIGATILHRNLVKLCIDRGIRINETYQLNLGGNTDFLNMTVEDRLKTKRISKTEAVTSLVPYQVPTRIGPSDYVSFLGDKKICYIMLEGKKFGDQSVKIQIKLEVEDSPNSAGVVIDVIRATKIALDRKIAGPLTSISSYAFKHPPIQIPDDQARQLVEEYINGNIER